MPNSAIADLIESEDDQILILPEGFELDSDQVRVSREGRKIVLEPVPAPPVD